MSNSKFLKKLTAAEVGKKHTHEVYIRFPNDFDFESYFNNSHIENGSVVEVNFNATVSTNSFDNIAPQSYDLRFVYFANSNKEKRIPGLAQLFKTFRVEKDDVVCLEKKEDNTYSLTFLSPDTLQIYNGGLLLNGSLEKAPFKNTSNAEMQPLQQIFFGAPGVGKSHHLKSVYKNKDFIIRTTFHPETDYASFVGCYKPQSENNEIVYKFQGQAFTEAYIKAWKKYIGDDEYKDIFLVIEEINRGNCAQIFGDIFQLLDRNETGFSDYSVVPDKDLQSYLLSQFKDVSDYFELVNKKVATGEEMVLPPNLHILATMNTSDQSLFPIDSAFKRRWDWVYMPIDTAPIDSDGKQLLRKIHTSKYSYDWGTFLSQVNSRIYETTLSEDKQLGFWFVKPKGEDGIISASDFVSKVVFFLWNDIYKDYVDDTSSIFNFAEDGNPDSKKKSRYSFRDFTPKFQQVNNNLIDAFIKNLGVEGKSLATPAQSENVNISEVQQSGSNENPESV